MSPRLHWRVVRIRGTERTWIEGGSRNFSQYCGQVWRPGEEFRVGVFLGSHLFCCFYTKTIITMAVNLLIHPLAFNSKSPKPFPM